MDEDEFKEIKRRWGEALSEFEMVDDWVDGNDRKGVK